MRRGCTIQNSGVGQIAFYTFSAQVCREKVTAVLERVIYSQVLDEDIFGRLLFWPYCMKEGILILQISKRMNSC